jgi:hypothetical protein
MWLISPSASSSVPRSASSAGSYKGAGDRKAMEAAGAALCFLPAFSRI